MELQGLLEATVGGLGYELVDVELSNRGRMLRIFIDKTEIPPGALKGHLSTMFADRAKKEVFLKADRDVPYGEVVKAMAEIKGAGIERLGMVTEPAQGK